MAAEIKKPENFTGTPALLGNPALKKYNSGFRKSQTGLHNFFKKQDAKT